jgi:hypothetical protein
MVPPLHCASVLMSHRHSSAYPTYCHRPLALILISSKSVIKGTRQVQTLVYYEKSGKRTRVQGGEMLKFEIKSRQRVYSGPLLAQVGVRSEKWANGGTNGTFELRGTCYGRCGTNKFGHVMLSPF